MWVQGVWTVTAVPPGASRSHPSVAIVGGHWGVVSFLQAGHKGGWQGASRHLG